MQSFAFADDQAELDAALADPDVTDVVCRGAGEEFFVEQPDKVLWFTQESVGIVKGTDSAKPVHANDACLVRAGGGLLVHADDHATVRAYGDVVVNADFMVEAHLYDRARLAHNGQGRVILHSQDARCSAADAVTVIDETKGTK